MPPNTCDGGDRVSKIQVVTRANRKSFFKTETLYCIPFLPTAWTGGDIFQNFDLLADYLGLVIPLGISAAATSLMCLVSAKEAGDPYPVRESLIADGIGTCIASFFGSPFGTVLYVSSGHNPALPITQTPSHTHSPNFLVLG
jgi:hypothetical protein